METTEETPNPSKSPSPESKSIAPEHVSEDEPNSLNGDGGMVVVKHFTDSGKEKTEKTEKEGAGNKPVKDNGLVIHDISKEIAKVDTDDSESADDILNDINSNQGLKRKASEAVEDGGNDNSNNSVNVSATIRSKEDPVISDSDLTIEKQTLGKGKRARIPNKRYSDILISPNQRSKIENGSEKIESEDSSNKEEPLPPVVVQSNKRRVVDMKNPKFLKPFQLGWKREMVWRASSDQFNKIAGDIYYYAPTGKKIRSMRELSEALKTTKDLTIENFTFMKEAVGLNDPEKEIIRDAKKPNSAGKKVIGKSTKSSKVASPKIPSTKVSSPKVSKAGPTEGEGKSKIATKKLGNFKVKAPSKSRDRKNRTDDSTEIDSDTSKSSKGGRWTSAPFNRDSTNKPCQPCSIRCEGVLGVVPTLQCRICLCLYHHECVGYTPHLTLPYVCKNCHLEDQTVVDTGQSATLNSPPPLTPINTLKSVSAQSTVLPKLQRIPRPDDTPEHQEYNSPPTLEPELPRLIPQPIAKRIPELFVPPQVENNTNSLVGQVTTWLPHNSKIVDSIQRISSNEPTEAPRPQYLEILGGRKFLVIPKHNFMSVSPTVAATANSRRHDTLLTTIESPENNTSEPTDSGNVENDKFDPESPSKPENSVTQEAMKEKAEGNEEKSDDQEENSESSSRQRGSGKFSNAPDITHSSLVKEEPKIAANYLQNVSYLYKTLLCVFQYLKVQDLVKAGSVCSMWYDAVNHRQLWQTVRMKNSQIHCFEGLTNMLKKHGTVHLDLRKMLFPTLPRTPEMSDTEYKQKEDQFLDDFWSNFPKAIEKVTTLRKIDLCRCPAFVVEKLAVSHPDLEVLNAVSIKCEKLAFEQFSVFKNIQELRIKSTLGLTLTSGGLDALKGHKKLTHLSLTSIRDLNKFDLSVIAELPELVLLELGECTNFPENFGETILIKLKKLEKLRLEKGQDECHTFEILNTVKIMPKLEQLELVNFDIKQGFDKALGECVNIKKLLLIPTYISQSATTNHMVLGAVIRLQHTLTHFVWGVTLELLRVTELFVGQLEEPPQKKQKVDKSSIGQGDCIPVLKPIPFNIETTPATGSDAPQVEILPLPQLQLLLMQSLPKTRVKILKIPFHATWRQTITDPVS